MGYNADIKELDCRVIKLILMPNIDLIPIFITFKIDIKQFIIFITMALGLLQINIVVFIPKLTGNFRYIINS